MSPDSTDFLKTLFDPQQWNLSVILGILVAMAGAFFEYFGFRSYRQQRRTQKLLEKSFGSDLYGPEVIERSTRYYVPPNCSSVDPAQEAELRRVMPTEEKLFEKIDKYLTKDDSGRHLLLLADSGMGKSSFVLNCYARNQRLPKRKRQRLAVVPLGIPDADEEIAKIGDQPNTVIFLDAFDEDTKAIKDHRQRLLELMHACRKFKRVLITCRTQFFPSAEEIPRETGIARVGPRTRAVCGACACGGLRRSDRRKSEQRCVGDRCAWRGSRHLQKDAPVLPRSRALALCAGALDRRHTRPFGGPHMAGVSADLLRPSLSRTL